LSSIDRGYLWEALDVKNELFPRTYFGLIRDPARGRFLLHSGENRPGDLWSFDPAELSFQRIEVEREPPGRTNPVMVLDTKRDRIISLGGRRGREAVREVWAFDPNRMRWSLIADGGPDWSSNASAVYDQAADRILATSADGVGALWMLSLEDPEEWQRIDPRGAHAGEHPRLMWSDDALIGFGRHRWTIDLASIECERSP
jgi:hypothetical protein